MVSDSGDLLVEYLHHFKDPVQPTKNNLISLVLDNYTLQIILLPPHSSVKIQSVDWDFFDPLKMKYADKYIKCLNHHSCHLIGQTIESMHVDTSAPISATDTLTSS